MAQTDTHNHGHGDSMTNSAQWGRVGENAILLVLPIEEISLRPELSSPARFRIQGGSPERDTGVVVVGVAGRHFSFLI